MSSGTGWDGTASGCSGPAAGPAASAGPGRRPLAVCAAPPRGAARPLTCCSPLPVRLQPVPGARTRADGTVSALPPRPAATAIPRRRQIRLRCAPASWPDLATQPGDMRGLGRKMRWHRGRSGAGRMRAVREALACPGRGAPEPGRMPTRAGHDGDPAPRATGRRRHISCHGTPKTSSTRGRRDGARVCGAGHWLATGWPQKNSTRRINPAPCGGAARPAPLMCGGVF